MSRFIPFDDWFCCLFRAELGLLELQETTYSFQIFYIGRIQSCCLHSTGYLAYLFNCSILFELGFPVKAPVQLFCDNISASYLTANPVQHARSKHIQIDYHFVRERVAHGDLIVKYIPTQLQLADIFTKSLSSQQFHFLKDNLRVVCPAQFE
ncbi:unnamed protein product, partial [Cuscuta epithymum]